MAKAAPTRAEAEVARLLSTTSDPWLSSLARHARGLILRDGGQLEEALAELRVAARLARLSADPDRLADVRATLGAALAMAGRTAAALRQLDLASKAATDPRLLASVLMRRGAVLSVILGRHHDALADLRGAVDGARRAGDRLWEARSLNTLARLHLAVGDVETADAEARAAHDLFAAEGEEDEAVQALHNLGLIAYCRGDLPTTLSVYDEVTAGYRAFGIDAVDLAVDHCQALMAAGLPEEACRIAAEQLARDSLHPVSRAEVQLTLAHGELARGDPAAALLAARAARATFRRQHRDWWALRAELAILDAQRLSGARGSALAARAADVARRLEAAHSDQAPAAWLLAERLAARGRPGPDAVPLARVVRYRRHPSGLVRASAWLAHAIDREAADDRRGLLLGCRRGLDALDDYRATLGSTELRALASRHGQELADTALRHAVTGRPRDLLWWCERWRATALAEPSVRPPPDPDLAGALAALRDNERRLEQARVDGAPTAVLERDRRRREDDVRRRRHLARGTVAPVSFDTERLVAAVGSGTFVELAQIGHDLHGLLVSDGRVRSVSLGRIDEAARAVDYARFVLRQSARGRPASLDDAGARLQAQLLAPMVPLLPDGPVVVSPARRLHLTPWSLLPALRDRAVTVVPSAASWLRARERRAETSRRVLVTGPRLSTGGAEVPELARRHPEAVVLTGADATVDRTLAALDGAGLAHVAAHGRFRSDSPMFSALELADGPLTVHDFERLDHAPHRFVLSACVSGVMAPAGADELLGLSAALLGLGTAGVLSSIVPVDDAATSWLMLEVHRRLDEGAGFAEVMLGARLAARGDRVAEATAAAFLALGC